LGEQIQAIERQIASWQRRDEQCRRIKDVPGVGLLKATAVIATVGEAGTFRSGREFAAFLGLVPRQSGTGGRVKLLGISKRGDGYLHTLLIHGARAVLAAQRRSAEGLSPWLGRTACPTSSERCDRCSRYKMARIIWALLVHGRTYQKNYRSTTLELAAV
jgi:transposase